MTDLVRTNIKMLPFRSEDRLRIRDLYMTLNNGVEPPRDIQDTLADLLENHRMVNLFDKHKESGAYLEIADLYRFWKTKHYETDFFKSKKCFLNSFTTKPDPLNSLSRAMTYFHETNQTHNFVWVPLHSGHKGTIRAVNIFEYFKSYSRRSACSIKPEVILQNPYWDIHPEALNAVLNDPDTSIDIRKAIQDRMRNPHLLQMQAISFNSTKPMTVERLHEIVGTCQLSGNLSSLREEFQIIENESNALVGNVLTSVNTAFDNVGKTFWELREFVNASQPGSYAYPLPAPASAPASTAGFISNLRAAFNEWRNPAPVVVSLPKSQNPVAQYARVINASNKNIEQMDAAIDALYKLNRLGTRQVNTMTERRNVLLDYLSRHGAALSQRDPIITDVIKAAADNLHRSVRSTSFVEQFTVGLAQRIMPVRDSMAAAASGSTVLATLQTAKSVVANEQWTQNFHQALERMAVAGSFITAELKNNAEVLRDVGDVKAAALASRAQEIHTTVSDYAKELKATGNPGTAIGLLATPAPPAP